MAEESWLGPISGRLAAHGGQRLSLRIFSSLGLELQLNTFPDSRFQSADSRFQIPDFRFQVSDFRFQISEFGFQISDSRGTGLRRLGEPLDGSRGNPAGQSAVPALEEVV